MMKLPRRFILLLLFVAQQVWSFSSFDVCVDALNGIDEAECTLPKINASNSPPQCCRTLSYAFDKCNKTNPIIALNGGDVEQMFYVLNASIRIDRNLTMTRSDTSHFAPVVKFDSQQRTNFAFTVQSSSILTMISIQGIHFVDTNIIQCQDTSCHLNISDCQAVCEKEGCSKTTFVYFKNNPSVSSFVAHNSYFKADRYLLSSVNSKHLNIDMRHVRMVNNRIYVTNKDLSNRATIRFQNITSSGVFSLYVIRLYGYFGSVYMEQLHIRNATMKVKGVRLEFRRNLKRLVPLFLTKILIENTTNFGEKLLDVERALVNVKEIVISGSTLTSGFQFYKSKGNLSHIDTKHAWFRHVLVLQFVDMRIEDITVSQCEFEKVDYRDYRFGKWSPRARKSLIFIENSEVIVKQVIVRENIFHSYLLYTIDANLTLDTADFTNNTFERSLFSNEERGYVTYNKVNITKNFIGYAVYYLLFLIQLKLSSVMISGNIQGTNFFKGTFIYAERTNIVLSNINISRSTWKRIIDIKWTKIFMSSCIFSDNHISRNAFFIQSSLFVSSDTVVNSNKKGPNEYDILDSLFYFTSSSSQFNNIKIINNINNSNLIHGLDSQTVIRNMNIVQNMVQHIGILISTGSIQLYNVTIKRNKWSTSFYFEESDVLIDGVQSIDNIIIGESARFLFYDGFSPSNISTGSGNPIRFIPYLFVANVYIEDEQRNMIVNNPSTIAIGAYYLALSIHNLTIVLKKFQRNGIDSFLESRNKITMQNISFACPTGSNVLTRSAILGTKVTYKLLCEVCPFNYYSTSGGFALLDGIDRARLGKQDQKIITGPKLVHQENVTCNKCPTGGECQAGVTRSRANYYGFKTTSDEIEYVPCLPQYCCDNKETFCRTYNTCNTNRYGALCGSCMPGYRESYFSNKCMSKEICNHQFIFWAFFFVTAICVMLFLCFMDNIKAFVIYVPKILYDRLTKRKNKSTKENRLSMCQLTKMSIMKGIDNNAFNSDRETAGDDDVRKNECKQDGQRDKPRVSKQEEVEKDSTKPYTMQDVLCVFQSTKTAVIKSIDRKSIDSTSETGDVNNKENEIKQMVEATVRIREEVEEKSTESYTMQGVFSAMLSFYQITSLLAVYTDVKSSESKFEESVNYITDLFNFEMYFKFKYDELCPVRDLDAVSKRIIKFGLFNFVMLVIDLLLWISCFIYNKATQETNKKSMPGKFMLKLETAVLRIITFGYKNITTMALLLVGCVKVNYKFVLYIDGTLECFQSQQYYVLAFISLWVIPMPFSLFYAYRFYINGSISFREMLVCLLLPPLTVVFAVIAKRRTSGSIQHDTQQLQQVREMYEEPYRLVKGSSDRFIFWEHWRLLQRLVLSIIISYVKDPLWKIYFSGPLILLFFLVYLKVRPFKKSLFILNWLEIASLIGICYQMSYNLFKGYIYLHNVPNSLNSMVLTAFFVNTEFLFTPLTLFAVYILFNFFVSKVINKIRNRKK